MAPILRALVIAAAGALVISGCGDADSPPAQATSGVIGEAERRAEGATESHAGEFPAPRGRTLPQVANALDGAGPQVYGKTAVYVADSRVQTSLPTTRRQ